MKDQGFTEIIKKIESIDSFLHQSDIVNKQKASAMDDNSIEDEFIDFKRFFRIIWEGRLQVLSFVLLFSIITVGYSFSLPNIYSSTVKLVPTQQESQSNLSSLASKYGGLASLAGINIGNGSDGNRLLHALELMHSWPFLEKIVRKYDLKPVFMAVTGWNPESNQLIYNEKIYNHQSRSWNFTDKVTLEPSSYETYEKLVKEFLNISFNDDIGVLTIEVKHFSPSVAYELTTILTTEINEHFRLEDQLDAKASISFIEEKIKSTSNTQMLEVFYSMIESHTQTIMFTEINEEYLVKTLIPAKISDFKNKVAPKRAVICIFGALIGGMLGCIWVSVRKLRSQVAN